MNSPFSPETNTDEWWNRTEESINTCHNKEKIIGNFIDACRNGKIKRVQNIVKTYGIFDKRIILYNHIFSQACSDGRLEICKWLVRTFNLTAEDVRSDDNSALRWACKKGHLEVFLWLVSTFNLSITDARSRNNFALRMACREGYLKVCKWLVGIFEFTAEDVKSLDNYELQYACDHGLLEKSKKDGLEVYKWSKINTSVSYDKI